MNGLLNMRICRHHLGVQVRVFCDHYLRVECCSNENSVDTAAERGCEDIGDLQTNQECKRNDNGGVFAVAVVRRRGEDQVQVGQESAQVSDGCGTLSNKSVRIRVQQQ